jgi:DNA-directed RNA polymerase sigma subunit (sigma70/sigma32)
VDGPGAVESAVAAATGLSRPSVRRLHTAAQVVASLDEPVGDGDATLGELTADIAPTDREQDVAPRAGITRTS